MKQNYFLLSVALGISVLFISCEAIPETNNDSTSVEISANSIVYPSIPQEPGIMDENGLPVTIIKNNQIVVDLGDLDISHIDSIFPNVIVESCPCGDPDIKLLTLPDDINVETAVATVRESDDDSNVKADKNFEFGFPILDAVGDDVPALADNIVNPLLFDLGFIDELETSSDMIVPVIAIVDTGIFPNAFRENEITLFRSSEVCDPETAGWNFVDNDNNLIDDIMHGTFVAKRIANRIKELDTLGGTNTNYSILPLKVFSNGRGEYFDVVCAFSYIQQLIDNGVQIPIINASFGSSLGNLALTDLLVLKKYIDGLNKSSIIVASAGNEGVDNAVVPHFPSGYNDELNFVGVDAINPSNNIIAVAGYELKDAGTIQLAPKTVDTEIGSNFGMSNVDLAAPWAFRIKEVKENEQTIIISGLQGTSYSAAYASGDLFHFLINDTDAFESPNFIPTFLDAYFTNDGFGVPTDIKVIGGKFIE